MLFTSDFGRDIYQAIKIAQGDLVLIGSKMNLGGYFAGPYLYYILAIGLAIGRYDIASLLYFHTLLFASGIGFFFFITFQKLNPYKALSGAIFLGLTPLFLMSARYPSNGYSYLALILFLTTLVFFLNFESKRALFILGLLFGVILNIHPISILALFFIAVYIFFKLKKKHLFLIFLASIFLTFIPLLAFELKHDFVMTKDTFINKSYLTFTEDGNTPQFWLHQNKLISSALFISQKFQKLLTLPPLVYLALVFLALETVWLKRRKLVAVDLFLASSMIISLLLLMAVLRFHFELHYLFSVAFYFSFATLLVLLRSKFWFLTLGIILLELQFFPVNLYQESTRSLNNIEQAVKFTLEQKLVSKDTPFNLIHIYDAYGLVPTGFEYRFFFRKHGLRPASEYDYQTPKILLIFSETPYYDIDRFKMWATEQFGRQYFSKRKVYQVGNITIYRISKD